jgi:hypothetical protein
MASHDSMRSSRSLPSSAATSPPADNVPDDDFGISKDILEEEERARQENEKAELIRQKRLAEKRKKDAEETKEVREKKRKQLDELLSQSAVRPSGSITRFAADKFIGFFRCSHKENRGPWPSR